MPCQRSSVNDIIRAWIVDIGHVVVFPLGSGILQDTPAWLGWEDYILHSTIASKGLESSKECSGSRSVPKAAQPRVMLPVGLWELLSKKIEILGEGKGERHFPMLCVSEYPGDQKNKVHP